MYLYYYGTWMSGSVSLNWMLYFAHPFLLTRLLNKVDTLKIMLDGPDEVEGSPIGL